MCMNLLRALAGAPPPCTVSGPVGIDRLRVLQAAGLVDARIPPSRNAEQAPVPAAVKAITPRGWDALRTNTLDEPAWQPPRLPHEGASP